MICKPCRQGGKWNAEWAKVVMEPGAFQSLEQLAKGAHGKCKGGTQCDCQHVVGMTARAGKEPK